MKIDQMLFRAAVCAAICAFTSPAFAATMEQIRAAGAEFEPAGGWRLPPRNPAAAAPGAQAVRRRPLIDLKAALTLIVAGSKEMKLKHEPLRAALIDLERAKAAYEADAPGRAGREPAVAELLDKLIAEMPVQTSIASVLSSSMTAVKVRLNPPVAATKEEKGLLEAAAAQINGAYHIPKPAQDPMLGGRPHPLAKYSGFLPDRVEIAVDQIAEIGASAALRAKFDQVRKTAQAYNKAMYGMSEELHQLQHLLEVDHHH